MEKVKIAICGREYPLKVDESPERIEKIAKELESNILALNSRMTGKSEAEVVTLTALLMLDEADRKATPAVDSAEYEKLREQNAELESKLKQLNDEILSAQSEMNQIADVQSDENEQLRAKLQEYEQIFERFSADKEKEIAELKASFESGGREMEQIADVKNAENEQLRQKVFDSEAALEKLSDEKNAVISSLQAQLEQYKNAQTTHAVEQSAGEADKMRRVLAEYEKTFDEYVKTKESEIKKLQVENEQLKSEKASENA